MRRSLSWETLSVEAEHFFSNFGTLISGAVGLTELQQSTRNYGKVTDASEMLENGVDALVLRLLYL
jgi:hypothetical protein